MAGRSRPELPRECRDHDGRAASTWLPPALGWDVSPPSSGYPWGTGPGRAVEVARSPDSTGFPEGGAAGQ